MNQILSESGVADLTKSLGRTLTPDECRLLTIYLSFLVKWNRRMNLVGPSSWPEILTTLIHDSWHLADLLRSLASQPTKTLDLGAGAGLPGIPLRIFWHSGNYCLVEPRQKRALFMEHVLASMKLPQTKVACCRMEALPSTHRSADLIVSRAFMPWKKLLMEVQGFLIPEGRVLIMSNDAYPGERVEGYAVEQTQDYAVADKKRYFWLFTRVREGL